MVKMCQNVLFVNRNYLSNRQFVCSPSISHLSSSYIALPEGSGSMLCLLTGQYLCTLGPPAIVSESI